MGPLSYVQIVIFLLATILNTSFLLLVSSKFILVNLLSRKAHDLPYGYRFSNPRGG